MKVSTPRDLKVTKAKAFTQFHSELAITMDDDADSFALVVEFEENSVPRLKNKLVKYFQSKRRSGGGECQIEYEDRSSTALLRFRREEGEDA